MGELLTEIYLLNQLTSRNCFVRAKILPSGQLSNADARNLLKWYIGEEHFFSLAATSFSNRIVAAHDAIKSSVVDNSVEPQKFPAVVTKDLTETVERNVQSTLKQP